MGPLTAVVNPHAQQSQAIAVTYFCNLRLTLQHSMHLPSDHTDTCAQLTRYLMDLEAFPAMLDSGEILCV